MVRIMDKGDPGPAWADLTEKDIALHCTLTRVVVIQGGMQSGLPSVALVMDLPDGKKVVAEVSARLFETASGAVRGACKKWGVAL